MKIPLVDLKKQYESIKEEIDFAIQDALDNTSFILGSLVEQFEENFANFCDSNYAVGVSSGTSALTLALNAFDFKKGSEIITVPNTFIATAEAISHAGLKPVFVEIDPKTYTIDPSKIEEAITKKTKAIIPVHLFGHSCDMGAIKEIAERYDLKIISDCAQAHGCEYKGSRRATIGDIGCFSFYPGKNLGAYGDAGAIVTNDNKLAETVKMLRNHGRKEEKYKHLSIGFNYRLDALQAAILDTKLSHLDDWTNKRRKNAVLYNEQLKDISTPLEAKHSKHVYHLYVIRVKNRDELKNKLKEEGISAGIHYPIPLHLQEAYSHLNYKKTSFSITEKYSKEILSLPMFPELSKDQITYACNKINEFYA